MRDVRQRLVGGAREEIMRAAQQSAGASPFEQEMIRRETGFLMAAIPAGFLPAAYALLVLHMLIAALTGTNITPERGGSLWWIGTVAIWLTFVQWPFYFFWTATSRDLSVRQKVAWGVVIFLGNMFAMPYFFWCKYRNGAVSGLLSIIGMHRLREYLRG